MTPYHLLAEAVKANPNRSLLDVWNDFAGWEKSRCFRDDPNASQAEIDWLQALNESSGRLEERLRDSSDCRNAFEAAVTAFAGPEQERQLYDAMVSWRQYRMKERDRRLRLTRRNKPLFRVVETPIQTQS